jgi:hypothetical protein
MRRVTDSPPGWERFDSERGLPSSGQLSEQVRGDGNELLARAEREARADDVEATYDALAHVCQPL